jgi:O-acetyl-ADP-ribose deacetylase (regulator of RNase III)
VVLELKLSLRSLDPEMLVAWRDAFADVYSVDYAVGNILDSVADAIVSPANSFGHMGGGVDLAYRNYFGPEIETNLRLLIQTEHHGELPVGQAVVTEMHHRAIPFLVTAPTMRVPTVIDGTVNVYLAFRAALLAVRRHNASSARPISTVLSPAFGTGVGGMDYRRAARQMGAAYRAVILDQREWTADVRSALLHHRELLQ